MTHSPELPDFDAPDQLPLSLAGGFQPTPLSDEVRIPRSHRKEVPRSDRFSRTGAALVASVGMLAAGGGALMHAHTSEHQSDATPRIVYVLAPGSNAETAPAGETPPVPTDVAADFKRALAVDTCKTRVSVQAVAQTYNRLFMQSEKPGMSLGELSAQADTAAAKLARDRARQGFVALPDSFVELKADAVGARAIPLSTYEEMASKYFGEVGVPTYFNWNKHNHTGNHATDKAMDAVAGIGPSIPIHETQTGTNVAARTQILATMDSIANMPPALFAAHTKALAFGDTEEHTASGKGEGKPVSAAAFADVKTGGMFIDIADKAVYAPAFLHKEYDFSRSTVTHETTHLTMQALCDNLLKSHDNRTDSDPAYASLNEGFRYGYKQQVVLSQDSLVAGKYGTLDSSPDGEDVVASVYGAQDVDEDEATLIGETVFNPANMESLLDASRNQKIIHEKVALEMTRLAIEMPEVAAYYDDLFAAAQVGVAVHAAAEPLSKQLRYLQTYNDGRLDSQGNSDYIHDPAYVAVAKQYAPYDKIIKQLETAIVPVHGRRR